MSDLRRKSGKAAAIHWALYRVCFNPVCDWINRRRSGTSGDLFFFLNRLWWHPVEMWDMAVGCPRCGWNDW